MSAAIARMPTSITVSTLALVAVGAASCGWTMVEPTDVIQVSEELPIKDRSSWQGALVDESFKLGSYKVSDVDRKWNSTQSNSFLGFEASRMKGGYSFGLVSGNGKLTGECATEERENSRSLGGGAEFSKLIAKLGCRCSDSGGAVSLTLEGSTSDQYKGAISGPDVEYTITAITERAKGPASHDPLGYRVDTASAPVGAVDLKPPGRVWISKALEGPAREQVACLFAGLLLYQPAKER